MLDRLQRALLLMRYDTGLTLAEIAHILGVSEAGVRRRLARAYRISINGSWTYDS
jgi:DNA-directed RNA polymerase specialized sigma24 family protein